MSNAKSEAIIRMKRGDFIKEHRELVKTLRTGKGIKKEAKEQGAELERYTRKN